MLVKLSRNVANKMLFHQSVNPLRWTNGGKRFPSTVQSGLEEQKVNVNGVNINYLRVGIGEHPVLLLPGAVGSIWTDFKPQIVGLDKKKLTIVVWDPPGYGKSRPPDRTFPDDFLQRDAVWACNLMNVLGYNIFSLIGWSNGGVTSLILASMFPNNVRKMVTVASNAYITPEEMNVYKQYRNIDTWSEKMRAPLIAVYGEDYFRTIWCSWLDSVSRICEKRNGDMCKESLPKIECPTLIIHGKKDPMVLSQHSAYLKEHIVGAKLIIFENGTHNLHLRYPEEFNDSVTKFLTE